MPMLALRRLTREFRRLLPVTLLTSCVVLSIIFLNSVRRIEPNDELYHRRRVDPIDERREISSAERQSTDTQALSHASNGLSSQESSDGKRQVKLQQKPVRWPWEGIDGCSHYGIRFAERGTLPVVALSSYPGSGNTWTRYMLELASGVFTGSIYYDMGLYSIGYWGEMSSPEEGTTIVQKVHDFGDDQVKRFNRTAIVIVRNPYRAVLSFHNYLFGGHKGMAPSSNYLRKGWRTFVMKQVFEWSAHVQKWTEPGNRVLVVHYEHLKSNPVRELRRMLNFLDWPIDEGRLRCVQADQAGVARRHQQHRPRTVTPFPAELRGMIDLSVRTTQNVLQHRHLPPLPVDEYEFFNGSSRRAEQLEDCREGELLEDCIYRIDRMNFRYHIKSWFETIRDHVRSSPLAEAFDGALEGAMSTARKGDGLKTAEVDGLSQEEEWAVERVVKTVQQSRDRQESRGDGILERLSGLLTGAEALSLAREERNWENQYQGKGVVGLGGHDGKTLEQHRRKRATAQVRRKDMERGYVNNNHSRGRKESENKMISGEDRGIGGKTQQREQGNLGRADVELVQIQ